MERIPPVPLKEAEQIGVKFAASIGANSLAALRAMSAAELLEATAKPETPRFPVTIDGFFFPKSPVEIYAKGEQAHVPLLVGWNSEEMNYRALLGQDKPTKENYERAVQKLYNEHAIEILKVYGGSTDEDVEQAATALASDRFIGYSTWKWS
ncbi:MAG: carboxylesterase family protein [Segetibacter sp.]